MKPKINLIDALLKQTDNLRLFHVCAKNTNKHEDIYLPGGVYIKYDPLGM